jgi:L-lactate utilization protein LutC
MSFFKKLLTRTPAGKKKEIKEQEVFLSLDDSFVHYFIKKGGKFLYSTSIDEVVENLSQILNENNWNGTGCIDNDLKGLLKKAKIKSSTDIEKSNSIFTSCEHLIADNGNILFSSNQLRSCKIASLPDNFIVYATTSQLVRDTGQGLTGIKTNFKGNIPTNISAIKNYKLEKNDDNFLNYGNSNSKNLYLLLFEDL